jgi:hypothetical protein
MCAQRISFSEAANLLPKKTNGQTVHVGTVRSWAINGIHRNGVCVKLEAERIGGRWFTTIEAVQKFTRECNGGTEPVSSPRRTGGMTAARRRLVLRGVYGEQKKRELLGLRTQGRDVRAVRRLLSECDVQDSHQESHKTGTNRRGGNAAGIHRASLTLQQPA